MSNLIAFGSSDLIHVSQTASTSSSLDSIRSRMSGPLLTALRALSDPKLSGARKLRHDVWAEPGLGSTPPSRRRSEMNTHDGEQQRFGR